MKPLRCTGQITTPPGAPNDVCTLCARFHETRPTAPWMQPSAVGEDCQSYRATPPQPDHRCA